MTTTDILIAIGVLTIAFVFLFLGIAAILVARQLISLLKLANNKIRECDTLFQSASNIGGMVKKATGYSQQTCDCCGHACETCKHSCPCCRENDDPEPLRRDSSELVKNGLIDVIDLSILGLRLWQKLKRRG